MKIVAKLLRYSKAGTECPGYEVTVVHGIRDGKIVWSRPEIVVMITLGMEKLMQHMLLGVHEVTEQCVVVVLDVLHSLMSSVLVLLD